MFQETPITVDRKEANKELLSQGLDECLELLKPQLDQAPLPSYCEVDSQSFTILNKDNQPTECRPQFVFSARAINFALRVRLLPAAYKADFPLSATQVKESALSERTRVEEIAVVVWEYTHTKSTHPHRLELGSSAKVNEAYQNSGIGTTLVEKGQVIKYQIAQKIGLAVGATELVTTIVDLSENEWTTRQVENVMTGFQRNPVVSDVFTKTEKL